MCVYCIYVPRYMYARIYHPPRVCGYLWLTRLPLRRCGPGKPQWAPVLKSPCRRLAGAPPGPHRSRPRQCRVPGHRRDKRRQLPGEAVEGAGRPGRRIQLGAHCTISPTFILVLRYTDTHTVQALMVLVHETCIWAENMLNHQAYISRLTSWILSCRCFKI